MALHKNLEKHIKTLNLNELEELFNILSSLLISPIYSSDFNEEIKEVKYFKGEICLDVMKIILLNMEKDMIDRDLSVKNVVRYLMKEHHLLFLVQITS